MDAGGDQEHARQTRLHGIDATGTRRSCPQIGSPGRAQAWERSWSGCARGRGCVRASDLALAHGPQRLDGVCYYVHRCAFPSPAPNSPSLSSLPPVRSATRGPQPARLLSTDWLLGCGEVEVDAPEADGAPGLEARTDLRQAAAPGAAPVACGVSEDWRCMELKSISLCWLSPGRPLVHRRGGTRRVLLKAPHCKAGRHAVQAVPGPRLAANTDAVNLSGLVRDPSLSPPPRDGSMFLLSRPLAPPSPHSDPACLPPQDVSREAQELH